MKKYFFSFIALLLLFSSCKPDTVALQLSSVTLELKVGEIKSLEVEGAPTADILWTSSNPDVATVFYGAVTALKPGITTITAQYEDASAQCVVMVVDGKPASLYISPNVISVNKGDTYQLTCDNPYDTSLSWSSSDESIVTVDQNGLVKALKAGYSNITASSGNLSATAIVAVPHKWGQYELVWSEDFDTETLNTEIWNYEVGGGGFGNNEKQYYTSRPKNIRLEDGKLVIEAIKETYENREYTSARINTKGKIGFAYGKVEARMKLPSGAGTWPAFWMMGQNYSMVGWPKCGEIDIMEHVGYRPNMVSFALHTKEKNGTNGLNWHSQVDMDNVEGEFHVYGIEWLKEEYNGRDQIKFTVDGIEYASSMESVPMDDDAHWPFNKDFFIILNLALGGNMGGSIDDAIFQNRIIMEVDWVRVYQRQEIE